MITEAGYLNSNVTNYYSEVNADTSVSSLVKV